MGGRKYDQGFGIPVFLNANNLKPFVTEEIIKNLAPVMFRPVGRGRSMAIGYRAELLPLVCNVFLDALEASALYPRQSHIAAQCKILTRGFAIVGINALIDEATGYQEVRDRLALQAILERYIGKELAAWEKTFPDEFYEQLYSLRGWEFKSSSGRKPLLVGRLTLDVVYQRLAPGVLEELRARIPKNERGKPRGKLFQMLTPDFGHPKLKEHLSNVVVLMKASTGWASFYKLLQRALPKYGATLELPFPDEES